MTNPSRSDRSDCLLAVDAGGTSFKYAPLARDGTLLAPVGSVPVDSAGTMDGILSSWRSVIEAVSAAFSVNAVLVSTPGPFDYDAGCSRMTHKFAAIRDLPLRPLLCGYAGREIPVRFMSDSAAFLAGEMLFGAARDARSCAGITIGTGLGFALAQGRRVLTSPTGGPRENIYNVPCREGILEDFVSGRGIVRLYRDLGGTGPLDAKSIGAEAEHSAVSPAFTAYRTAGTLLAQALTPFIVRYGIDTIVLGGKVARTFAPLLAGMSAVTSAGIRVVRADDIDSAALRGVLYTLREEADE